MSSKASILLSPQILPRLDKSGPRYTSYPTADLFREDFGPVEYERALSTRAESVAEGVEIGPLSLYVHIPFCESICYYCACNKVVSKNHDLATRYLEALKAEVALHVKVLGARQESSQLHLGGGTPTFFSDAQLATLLDTLRSAFHFSPDAELSIEVDPRTVTSSRLAVLAGMGFNRISFGVQDFDAQVQAAVHRIQPFESVKALVESARSLNFASINIDLIYGLPKQTPDSFRRTLELVMHLRPDRIALYGYAHLPQRFKPQRRINEADLPVAEQRIGMLEAAIELFTGDGYDYIGMDHFALPTDSLAMAKKAGRLHRNFQGYSTTPDGDILALGVSAIGRIGHCYSQNAKTLDAYYAALEKQVFPIERGMWLSRDDLIRRDVIMAVMCQGHLAFDEIEQAHAITVHDYFKPELEALEGLAADGLVQVSPRAVTVTPAGWHLVRTVAMVFDRHLAQRQTSRFSRVV